MNLQVTRCSNLPKMAWALEKNGDDVLAICGTAVEVVDNGLFEGGWSGAESWQPWSERSLYFGSGFYVERGKLRLISASHTCEAIYVLQAGSKLFASNSLAFLLASSKSTIKLADFSRRLWSLTRGLIDYDRKLFSGDGQTLSRFLACLVSVEGSELKENSTEAAAPAQSFQEYKEFLLRVVSDVRDSSGFGRLVSHVSKGYDSVACAALVKELGGGAALSIAKSRYGVDDSGEEIAQILGLDSRVIERPKRVTYPGGVNGKNVFEQLNPEDLRSRYEFYVGLNLADECLKVDDALLAGSIVLTGFHGGRIWDINKPANEVLGRGDSTGSSLYEFRLRVGFVHVPVPLVGALSHPDLLALGLSDDMAPWRLGNKYDRPIARRLAEEAGVPRSLFGQKKQAAATMTELSPSDRLEMFDQLIARYAGAAVEHFSPANSELVSDDSGH